MLTKLKIALVTAGLLVSGVAAAQGTTAAPIDRKAEIRAKRQAMKQEMLQKFDTNKDGTLDDGERTAMHDARVLERFKRLDTDGNGVLSLAEFKAGKADKRHARGKFHGMKRGHAGPRGLGTK